MPQRIKTVDQLALENNRDQLYVDFGAHLIKAHEASGKQDFLDCESDFFKEIDWDNFEPRKRFINFCKANGIKYGDCVIEPPGQLGGWSFGRLLYVDISYDEHHLLYKKLVGFLEYPDESPRYNDIAFCYFPVEEAKEWKKRKDQIEW
jgi:hypothetical protein